MYINKLIKSFKKKKTLFFTTPGHFQGFHTAVEFGEIVGRRLFKADCSETDGMDNLQNPSGAIKESMQKISKIYRSKMSFYLVNGSSSGIIALILSTVKRGEKILLSRNVHKSVINALVLSGAEPVWAETCWDEYWNIPTCVNPAKIAEKLEQTPDIKVLLITSPTYEGIVSDIEAMAKICQRKNVTFLVDEAHGALWNFSEFLPTSAIHLGADACVQSLHKTGSCLNQGAVLHLSENSKINPDMVQRSLNIINTTSPSYILLSSIEASIEYLNSSKGRKNLDKLIKNIENTKNYLKERTGAVFLENSQNYQHDPTKIFLGLENVPGQNLSDFLQDNFNIEAELNNDIGILALTGIGTKNKHLKKLANSVLKADKKLDKTGKKEAIIPFISPKVALSPAEAYCRESKTVEFDKAAGLISKETIVKYPPGIPLIIAGEIIQQEHQDILKGRQTIEVIKD